METWEDEIKKAVMAGEREFGPLNAHQTIQHNLVRRCQELLAELAQPEPPESRVGPAIEGDSE